MQADAVQADGAATGSANDEAASSDDEAYWDQSPEVPYKYSATKIRSIYLAEVGVDKIT